jgi:hypothetical protein
MKVKSAIVSAILISLAGFGLSACAPAHGANGAVVVDFKDHETGLAPYRTRMIVTPDYMRIDDGKISNDFVLFDRRARVIYSSSSYDQRILVVRGDNKKYPMPSRFVTRVDAVKEDLPKVSGHAVVHRVLQVNGKTCYDFYSAAGLLPQVVQAMKEFQQVLVGEHGAMLQVTPAGMTSDCDAVNNVYRPTVFLDYGFPVRATNSADRLRQLVDYHVHQKIDPQWFVLPAGYTKFTAGSMRGQ